MRTLAPVRVRIAPDSDTRWFVYITTCRACGAVQGAGTWAWCMAAALGHLSFQHPQWPQVDNGDGSRA